MSHAKFAAAFFEEFDALCDLMEKDGQADPDFTSEKRAAFGFIMANLEDDDDYAFMDKMASDALTPLEKIAIRGTLGRWMIGAGARMAGRGTKMVAKSMKPSKSFAARFTRKGWSPQRIQSVWTGYQKAGPKGWMRMRRATAPAFAGPAAAAASRGTAGRHAIQKVRGTSLDKMIAGTEGGGSLKYMAQREKATRAARARARRTAAKQKRVGKTTRDRAAAGAKKGKGEGNGKADRKAEGLWPSVKSGLLWGGGFGAAQRVLAPEEEPEYVLGN